MPNKNQSGVVVLLIPILIFMLGFVIAVPLFIFSTVKTLSVSNVYQYLFGSDASGVSYNNPGSVILGNGDHVFKDMIPCRVEEADWGDCGLASVLIVERHFNPQKFGDPTKTISTAGMSLSSLSSMLTSRLKSITGSWNDKAPNDFLKAQRSIDQGYPVLIYTGRYKSSKNIYGHIMVIIGYKNNGDFVINSSTKGGCSTEAFSAAKIQSWGSYYAGNGMIFSSKVQ